MVAYTNEFLDRRVNIPEHINNQLMGEIKKELDDCGLYYRLFGRIKSTDSIGIKLNKKKYTVGGKMMQDIIGLRVVVYFTDDIDLCRDILKHKYELDNEEYDHPSTEEFKPLRINMVFRMPERFASQMLIDETIPIDSTFEVQIRTVFSEGWHEIEHDLRYKRKSDWEGLPVYSRMLNGIFATLETCDWSIIQLLDSVAHEHYLHNNWIPMCINHFRLKFSKSKESDEGIINTILNDHIDLAKAVLRFDRLELVKCYKNKYRSIPHSLMNTIYIINLETIKNDAIIQITPQLILET